MLTMCINLKLVQVLQYLCQFNFNICYKLGKNNIMPDALLQLVSVNTEILLLTHNKFNILFITNVNFTATIVQMSNKL